jgi:hypothetical protein
MNDLSIGKAKSSENLEQTNALTEFTEDVLSLNIFRRFLVNQEQAIFESAKSQTRLKAKPDEYMQVWSAILKH